MSEASETERLERRVAALEADLAETKGELARVRNAYSSAIGRLGWYEHRVAQLLSTLDHMRALAQERIDEPTRPKSMRDTGDTTINDGAEDPRDGRHIARGTVPFIPNPTVTDIFGPRPAGAANWPGLDEPVPLSPEFGRRCVELARVEGAIPTVRQRASYIQNNALNAAVQIDRSKSPVLSAAMAIINLAALCEQVEPGTNLYAAVNAELERLAQ